MVTQEVEDIIGNEIVKNAIIANADCKILLIKKVCKSFRQNKTDFGFSDKETAVHCLSIETLRLWRAPYKECLSL